MNTRWLIWMTVLLPCVAAADIRVLTGPTPIPRGDAVGARDITVTNGRYAVAFAVESAPPWGVARGGIIDIALLRNGEIGYDFASLADFMPNNWSAWPTTYQRVTVEEQTPQRVTIRTERDWGAVALVTVFRIRDNDDRIDIVTTMENRGKTNLDGLLTGYVVWPDGGYLFNVPGLTGLSYGEESEALADWSAAYDRNWVLALHAPYAEISSEGGRDRYLRHSLAAGARASFEATLQILGEGDLAPVVEEDIRRTSAAAGGIEGAVLGADGRSVADPAIVASINGKPYAWTIGNEAGYALRLPQGRYEIYATAAGYSQTVRKTDDVEPGRSLALDFDGLRPPGQLQLSVASGDGVPLDARITVVAGPRSLIEFFGKNTFFTEIDEVGTAVMSMAPGDYTLQVSAGGGFTSLPRTLDVTVASGESVSLDAAVEVAAAPRSMGWYSADLHHHSDVLDGFSDPHYVLRSELAAGVDLTFLSDHDSVVNNAELERLSAKRGVDFIRGTELSPSWAHFNAYPLDADKDIEIDVGASTVQQIFAEARRLGADVVHVNHPYGDYGYFRSLELEVEVDGRMVSAVPGGYDDSFDIVEITAGDNAETMRRCWQLWNSGKRAYLAGGSDVHDVWNSESGAARTYVYIEGDVTPESFVAALKQGHAFASQGPLVFPEMMFGTETMHEAGAELALAYNVQAVAGLRSVQLIERGEVRAEKELSTSSGMTPVSFVVTPEADTWYSVIVEDRAGKFAYSNPVWISVRR